MPEVTKILMRTESSDDKPKTVKFAAGVGGEEEEVAGSAFKPVVPLRKPSPTRYVRRIAEEEEDMKEGGGVSPSSCNPEVSSGGEAVNSESKKEKRGGNHTNGMVVAAAGVVEEESASGEKAVRSEEEEGMRRIDVAKFRARHPMSVRPNARKYVPPSPSNTTTATPPMANVTTTTTPTSATQGDQGNHHHHGATERDASSSYYHYPQQGYVDGPPHAPSYQQQQGGMGMYYTIQPVESTDPIAAQVMQAQVHLGGIWQSIQAERITMQNQMARVATYGQAMSGQVSELGALKQQVDAQRQEMAGIARARDMLAAELGAAMGEAEAAKGEAEAAKKEAEARRCEAEAAKKEAEARRSEAETAKKEAGERVNEAEAQRGKAEARRSKAEARAVESEAQLEAAKKELGAMRKELETGRKESEKVRMDSAAALEAAEASQRELLEARGVLQATKLMLENGTMMKTRAENAEAATGKLRERAERAEAANAKLRERVEKVEASGAEVCRQLAEATVEARGLRAKVASLEEQLATEAARLCEERRGFEDRLQSEREAAQAQREKDEAVWREEMEQMFRDHQAAMDKFLERRYRAPTPPPALISVRGRVEEEDEEAKKRDEEAAGYSYDKLPQLKSRMTLSELVEVRRRFEQLEEEVKEGLARIHSLQHEKKNGAKTRRSEEEGSGGPVVRLVTQSLSAEEIENALRRMKDGTVTKTAMDPSSKEVIAMLMEEMLLRTEQAGLANAKVLVLVHQLHAVTHRFVHHMGVENAMRCSDEWVRNCAESPKGVWIKWVEKIAERELGGEEFIMMNKQEAIKAVGELNERLAAVKTGAMLVAAAEQAKAKSKKDKAARKGK